MHGRQARNSAGLCNDHVKEGLQTGSLQHCSRSPLQVIMTTKLDSVQSTGLDMSCLVSGCFLSLCGLAVVSILDRSGRFWRYLGWLLSTGSGSAKEASCPREGAEESIESSSLSPEKIVRSSKISPQNCNSDFSTEPGDESDASQIFPGPQAC